jgi:hypothetical protein
VFLLPPCSALNPYRPELAGRPAGDSLDQLERCTTHHRTLQIGYYSMDKSIQVVTAACGPVRKQVAQLICCTAMTC